MNAIKAAIRCLGLSFLCWCGSAAATTIMQFSFGELVDTAELIFQGEALDAQVVEDANGMLHTQVTFRVDEVVKGADPGEFVELNFLGGSLEGRELMIPGQNVPPRGERGIYFVENTSENSVNPLAGWTQGHFIIETDAQGHERLAPRQEHDVLIIDRSTGGPAQSASPLFMGQPPATPDELKEAIQTYMQENYF